MPSSPPSLVGLPICPSPTYLSSVAIKDAEDIGVAFVEEVPADLKALVHVVPLALDGVDGHIVTLEVPGLQELRLQDIKPYEVVILHDL